MFLTHKMSEEFYCYSEIFQAYVLKTNEFMTLLLDKASSNHSTHSRCKARSSRTISYKFLLSLQLMLLKRNQQIRYYEITQHNV